MLRAFRRSLIALAFLATFLSAFYFFVFVRFEAIANSAIFPGARHEALRIEPESLALGAYTASVPYGERGESVSALVLPSARKPGRALLYAHGNGERLSYIQNELRAYLRMGYTVVAYDYPGYGESGGQPSPDSFRLAAEAMAEYVHGELGFDSASTAYGGYSLGTAAALISAEFIPPSRLFLLAPFSSDRELAVFYTGLDLYRYLWRDTFFSNKSTAEALSMPVFIAHARTDATVPYSQGREVFDAFRSTDKTFVTLPDGTNHFFNLQIEPFFSRLRAFLQAPDQWN